MKKVCVAALGVAAVAGSAQAQSSVSVYGIVDSGVAYASRSAAPTTANPRATGAYTAVESGLLQASRFGFRGTEDLGGGLRAHFNLEGGLAIDTGTLTQGGALFGRKSTVGLSGSFGELHIGRRKDFIDELADPYSSITPFGTFITRVHANNLDRVGGNRANNMLYYSTPTVAGFRANVTYGFGETPGDMTAGQSLGFGAKYGSGPFEAGIGYWQSRLGTIASGTNSSSDQGATSGAGCNTTGLGQPGDVCVRTWMAGGRYSFGSVVVRGTFSRATQPLIKSGAGLAPNFNANFTRAVGVQPFTAAGANNDRSNIVDVGVDYYVGAWKLKASYIQSSYHFVGASHNGRLQQYIAGAEYFLSKRTTLYGTVTHMTAAHMYSPGIIGPAPGADSSQTAAGIGVRHIF